MMQKIIFLLCYVTCFDVIANNYFAEADVKAGQALVEKNCISCHASSYGGDGSEIYTRAFRKVDSSKALVSQVSTCNTNLDLKWFEEDEFNAAAYLNKQYYKFEQ
jgi:cytochrome c2